MFFRSIGNYDTRAASDDSALMCEDPSRTVQSMKDEADINVLVKRFGITGKMPVNPVLPEYQDFDSVFDFQTALNAVKRAEASFLALPATLRAEFDNSPQNLLQFVSDERNYDEAVRLGLIPAPAETADASEGKSPQGEVGRAPA